ncbi:MAG: diguanylate cyclase, partial [Proteobacteria bacterium]|nr:diguanylate cyclase [Pseudomonadota bacterium]
VGLMNDRTRLYLDISIGLADYPGCGTDVQELISAADAAMYDEKKTRPRTSTTAPPENPTSTPA